MTDSPTTPDAQTVSQAPGQKNNNPNGAERGGRPARRGRRGQGRSSAAGAPETRQPGGQGAQPKAGQPARQPRSHPLQVKLADLYPVLFGENPLPLKRGIFQDLVDAHPEALPADELKVALGLHTRSSRYLTAVAAGLARHDLAGAAVEAMAPEHVHHALLEVFRRRQSRTPEDLAPKLRRRIVAAYEASGLSREDYAMRVRQRDDKLNVLVDEALAEASEAAARDEALLRAYEASGQTIDGFADMYGRDPRTVRRAVEQAQRRRTA